MANPLIRQTIDRSFDDDVLQSDTQAFIDGQA